MLRKLLQYLGLVLLLAYSSNALPYAGPAAKSTNIATDQAAPAQTPPDQAALQSAVREMSQHLARVALDESGGARGDYDLHQSRWLPYERAWHTGQMIWGLLHAYKLQNDSEYLDAATRAGEWWITQSIGSGPLQGMLNAAHGDRLGELINFSTLSDGTPGLFALSQATHNPLYAQTAAKAASWSLQHLYLPDAGLVLNIVDPANGEIWRDRSPHHAARPARLNQVARPNIEGFLFLEAAQYLADPAMLAAFFRLADRAVELQHPNGLWMDFEPNDPSGKVHPRFNLWYAEALLRAANASAAPAQRQRYIAAAGKTIQTMRSALNADGSILYDLTDPRYSVRKAVQLHRWAGSSLSQLGLR